MAKVLTGISGNLISAASAGFAPTNSADVSAIASAYQVVSATATQLYAGTAYVTSVNGAPFSASRAGNAANASLASSAWYDGTGRLISALPDSAAVSAIASAYAESAASGKQDTLTFGYDDDKISAINGSALAGQGGGGGGSVVSPSGTILVTDGSSIEGTNSAVYLGPPGPLAVYTSAHPSVASARYYGGTIYTCDDASGMPAEGIDVYMAKITNSNTKSASFTAYNTSWEDAWTGKASWNSANNKAQLRFGTLIDVVSLSWGDLGGNAYLSGSSTSNYSIQFLKTTQPTLVVGELAWASAIPTYSYDTEDKISAINGSAIAGGGGGATGDYVEKSATSVAIGTANTAGAWSLVVGSGNKNARDESLIIGRNNSADMWAVAVGSAASASLDGLAVGYKAIADLGIAVGSEVSGWEAAVAVGNTVYGYNDSIAVGGYCTAMNTSISVGYSTARSGSYALGYGANANYNSFAHGMSVTANYTAMAFGTYNLSGNGSGSSGAAFVLGDGTASNARHDLMVVTKDGEITMYSGTADTTGTGIMSSIRALSANAGGVDSATVSAIASSYAESAVSSYQPLSGMSGYASAFSAGEGLEFVQSGSDQVLQVEAPVDVVAGPGIVIDNPDGNTLRVSANADSFFKELYYNATNVNDTAGKVYSLSEPITNFMYAKITVDNMEYTNAPLVYEIDVQHNTTTCQWNSPLRNGNTDNTINLPTCQLKIDASGNLVLVARGLVYNTYPSPQFTNGANRGMRVVRVVGIFRIAGGN